MNTGNVRSLIELTIVIPVYNSARIFPELYSRLVSTLQTAHLSFELIAVVDGCLDNSAAVIESHSQKDERVKLIEFSRNFGHQAAVTAGLTYARGNMIVIMDDDLEDPPEIIPEFVRLCREGYDVVYGVRKARKVPLYKELLFKVFYRAFNYLSEIRMPIDAGDFCLLTRQVVDSINVMPERNRYVRGLRTWVGFKQIGIEYARGSRLTGDSGYRLSKYLRLAMDAVFSFSYKPLHVFSYFGTVIALVGFILAVVFVVKKLIGSGIEVAGWVSLMIGILFLGGVQLISIGVLGEYIARIYDEVKSRPLFVVKRTTGINKGL
jgi:dolichol-phosphate mannosyltransferase